MNKILVIGPTYQTITIKMKDYLISTKKYQTDINNFHCGGISAVVESLLALDIETFFVTRLAYDYVGNSIMNTINKNGGFVYSNYNKLLRTPTKLFINDIARDITTFSSVSYENYPASQDGMPHEFINNQKFGLIDCVNTPYLENLLIRNVSIRWIGYDFIPDDRYLTRFDGVFLSKEKADSIINTSLFAGLTNKLFGLGLKWVVVYDGPTLCDVYTPTEIKSFTKEKSGGYPIGCFESFVAMSTACYINDYDLLEAVERGMNISNELSYFDEVRLKKEMF